MRIPIQLSRWKYLLIITKNVQNKTSVLVESLTELEVSIYSVWNSYTRDKGKIVEAVFAPEALENLMAKELEKQYPVLMETFYTLMDPEEMTILKKQAQEIKSQKGYWIVGVKMIWI